mgnify:FL=1
MIINRETKTNYIFKTIFPVAFENIIKSVYGYENTYTLTAKEYLMKMWCEMELSINVPLTRLLYVCQLDYDSFDINLIASLADKLDYLNNENVLYIVKEHLDKLHKSYHDEFINIVKSSSMPILSYRNQNKFMHYSLSEKKFNIKNA